MAADEESVADTSRGETADPETEDRLAVLDGVTVLVMVQSKVTEADAASGDADGGGMSGISGASDSDKSLFDQAVDVVAREGKASTSFIQRHLNIGYNKAAKLIEQMEKEGIVGAANHVGKREILVRRITDDMD